jgi:type VI secretion system protein VasD
MISRRTILAGLPALLAGCGGGGAPPPPAAPATLTLTLTGGADQNPSASGHASPVAIRLIQLGGTGSFERADVYAVQNREKATLGDDDLGSEEFVLRPGETRSITRELKHGAQFVGVAALFRDIDRAQWRAFKPVKTSGPTALVLTTKANTVSLAPA